MLGITKLILRLASWSWTVILTNGMNSGVEVEIFFY